MEQDHDISDGQTSNKRSGIISSGSAHRCVVIDAHQEGALWFCIGSVRDIPVVWLLYLYEVAVSLTHYTSTATSVILTLSGGFRQIHTVLVTTRVLICRGSPRKEKHHHLVGCLERKIKYFSTFQKVL